MSLINHYEIIEQDKSKLNQYLTNQLKNTINWRENRPDSIEDQCNFYKSYFGGEPNQKMHINQELLSKLLKESEEVSKNSLKTIQQHFLDFIYNDIENKIILYYYDSPNKKINEVLINLDFQNKENFIIFDDINESEISINTKLIEMKNFESEKIILADMYSIYELNSDLNGNINVSKKVTLTDIPACFISDILVDYFFIISEGNNLNWITLINEEYNVIENRKFNSTIPYRSGDFLSQNEVCACLNQNSILLCDFRIKDNENILYSNKDANLNCLKYIDSFYYLTISPENISLFDLRYPSIPISNQVMNINYSHIKLKRIQSNNDTDFSFLLYDTSTKDQSNIKLTIHPNKLNFLEKFCDFELLKNDKLGIDIHNTAGFLFDNMKQKEEILLNFLVDNLGGVFLNVYDLSPGKFDYSPENIANMKNIKFKDECINEEIKQKNIDDDIFEIYKNMTIDFIYKGNKDIKDIMDFGHVTVNEKEKKMYTIESKRNLINHINMN